MVTFCVVKLFANIQMNCTVEETFYIQETNTIQNIFLMLSGENLRKWYAVIRCLRTKEHVLWSTL